MLSLNPQNQVKRENERRETQRVGDKATVWFLIRNPKLGTLIRFTFDLMRRLSFERFLSNNKYGLTGANAVKKSTFSGEF